MSTCLVPLGSTSPNRHRPTPLRWFVPGALLVLLLSPFVARAENEPNDRLGDANPLSTSTAVSGAFATAGDYDWYRIDVDGPGRLTVSIQAPPPLLRSELAIYGRHADWLGVYATSLNDGDDLHLAHDLVEAGTWFVRARDVSGRVIPGNYSLQARFEPAPDASEPNDRVGLATLLTTSSVQGRIFPRGEEDWFRIHVPAGARLACELASPAAMRGEVALYDPDFAWLGAWSTAVNPGDTALLDHAVTRAGFYYLRIRDALSLSHLGNYRLSVAGGNPGFVPVRVPVTSEQEPDDSLSLATPIAPGTTVTGTVARDLDPDCYSFSVEQPGQLTVTLLASPANLALRLQLLDDSGNLLVSGEAGLPGDVFALTHDVRQPARFHLRASPLAAGSSADPYRFATALLPVTDPFEPNDRYGDAVSLHDVNQVRAFLFPASDQDWFRIQVPGPGEIRAIVGDLPPNLTPQIHLFDLSLNHLASAGGTPGTDLALSFTAPAPGTYLVRVMDARANAATAPYTLTLFGAAFARYAPVARIDRIAPGAVVVGDAVAFAGSGSDADGSVAAYAWSSSLDGDLGSQAAFSTRGLTAGTHTIAFRVRDNDGLWSTPVRELVYVGSTVSTEVEPNGSFFAANQVAPDRPFTAKIGERNDEDYLKIHLPSAGRLVAELSNVPTHLRLELTFYNAYWEWLGIYDSAASPGDDVSLARDLVAPGLTYLRIREVTGAANPDFTYTLLLRFTPAPDPFEPNNEILDATLLTAATVQAYHYPAGDEDWYRVWVPQGSHLQARLDSAPADVRSEIALYGRNREWLGRWESATNPGDRVSVDLGAPAPVAGFHYLRVRNLSGLSWTDTYQLTVTGAQPGFIPEALPRLVELEPNDAIADATPFAFGPPLAATFGVARDQDWFTLAIPSPGILRVAVSNISLKVTASLRVTRHDGQQVAYRAATNPGDPLVLEVRVLDDGPYYLQLLGDAGFAPDERYSLLAEFLPVVDPFEPNQRLQEPTVLTQQNRVQARIFDVGDLDCYRVRALAGQTLRVVVADVPATIRPQIEVFDHDARLVAQKLASNEGQEISLSLPVAASADYTLRIRDVGDNSFSPDPYTLVVQGAQFDSFVPLAVIDSVSPNPSASGQTVTFRGHGDDVDGTLVAYEWRSSVDGVFSASRIAETAALTPGTHVVSLRVMDDDRNWSPETSTLVFFGVPAPAESEPNDVAGAASPMLLDRQYTGAMDRRDDHDWFQLSLPAPGRLTLRAANPVGSPMRTRLELYSPDIEWIGAATEASNDGDPVTLTWDIAEAGPWYLRVRDSQSREGGAYTLSASLAVPPDPFERNADFAHASPLDPGGRAEAYVFPVGDEDWYRVSLPGPGALALALDRAPSDLRMEMAVYGPNLAWLGAYQTANNDGDAISLAYDAPAAGSYFLRVRAIDGQANPSEPYALSTSFVAALDPFEPNPDFARATDVQTSPLQARIFPPGDEDLFRLHIDTAGPLHIAAVNVPPALRLELSLYNASLQWIGVYATAPSNGAPVSLDHAATPGILYLRVRAVNGERDAGQPYELSFRGVRLDPVQPVSPGTSESEPNHDFASADPIAIGPDPVTGTLAGDADWFRFDVAEPGELALDLAVSAAHRSRLQLYDASLNASADREAENRGDRNALTLPIAVPGSYYLRLSDIDGISSPDPYQLRLGFVAAPDPSEPNDGYERATPIPLGSPVQGRIFPRGDDDWYVLRVPERGHLELALDSIPPELLLGLRLHDRNLQQLAEGFALNPGDPVSARFEISAPGDYVVRVWDQRDNRYSTLPYTFGTAFVPVPDPNEPNNRFRDATLLAERNQATGRIHPVGDVDWFRFSVPQPGPLRIQIAQTTGFQPALSLRNDSGNALVDVAARNPGDVLELTYSATAADTFLLRVSDAGGNQMGSESYVVSIVGGAFQQSHPLVDRSPAFAPNPALAGQSVRLDAPALDPDGSVAAWEWTSDLDGPLGTTSPLAVPNLSTGIHRLAVRARDASGLWSARVDRTLIVAPSLLAEAEYNNSVATAYPVPLGTWIVGQILPATDEDYFKVYVDRPGRLEILLSAVAPSERLHLTAYDAEGRWLGHDSAAANPGESVDLAFFVSPGWHHVRVRDADNRAGAGTYALRVALREGVDLNEPNASIGLATPLPLDAVVTNATVSPAGDEDWYSVEVPVPGRLTVTLDPATPTLRGSIAVYDHNLAWLGVYQNAVNDGDRVLLAYDVPQAGRVHLQIRNNVHAAVPEPYRLSLGFVPAPDQFEPNPGGGTATLLTTATLQARIFPHGDEDWYRIHLATPTEFRVTLTEAPAAMRAEISLYGHERQWLGHWQTANNPGDSITVAYPATATSPGFVYVRVRDAAGASHVEPYRLAVTGGSLAFEPAFDPRDTDTEPNSSWATATDVRFDADIPLRIDPAADEDYFRVWINAPGTLRVAHTRVPATVLSEIWVLDRNLDQVAYRRTTNPGEDNVLVAAAETPGYHYIRIHDQERSAPAPTPSLLRITLVPVIDSWEPNDTLGQAATSPESSVRGHLFGPSDVDWYRVWMRQPGPLALSLEAVPSALRPEVRIYDANGTHRGSYANTNPGIGGTDVLVYNAPDPGFYFIRVHDAGGQFSELPYLLRISGADTSPAPSLDAVGPQTLTETIEHGFLVSALDPDNPGQLRFSARNLPPGATFDPPSRTFRWRPATGQAGTYPGVRFEVTDGSFTDGEDVTFTVLPLDRAPVLAPIGPRVTQPGVALVFQVSATDPDPGDTLVFSAANLPRGATFQAASRTFSWTPAADQLGLHRDLRFVVTDGTRSDFELVEIKVTDQLDPYQLWLRTHFTDAERLDPGVSGPDADPDQDGAPNRDEFEADTLPRDVHSVLAITGLVLLPHGLELRWQGGEKSIQYLERRASLPDSPEAWTVLHTNTPPTPIIGGHIDPAPDATSFYRLRVQRP